MGIEIERKFLLNGSEWKVHQGIYICQGYLNKDPKRSVRIRIADNEAFLTIKGHPNWAARAEFEYSIPLSDARHLIEMCDGQIVEKIRRVILCGELEWEVDEFLGANVGLAIAEVEIASVGQKIEIPTWVGREVTGNRRYFNLYLASNPFSTWETTPNQTSGRPVK